MVLNPRHKERVDNLETANQEIDRLRKSLDKLQGELNEAHQEAEVWLFHQSLNVQIEFNYNDDFYV